MLGQAFDDNLYYKDDGYRTPAMPDSLIHNIDKMSGSGSLIYKKKGKTFQFSPDVRVEGLEPPCREAPDPKSGVSTNFTTPAA